jgi:hypothetical protein
LAPYTELDDGIDEMLYAIVPATLQDVRESHQVGVHIGVGVLQRVPDPRLGRQVDDPLRAILAKYLIEGIALGDIHARVHEVV